MNAALITAICTGAPALLAAVGAFIASLKASNTATAANAKIDTHIAHVTSAAYTEPTEHLMPKG